MTAWNPGAAEQTRPRKRLTGWDPPRERAATHPLPRHLPHPPSPTVSSPASARKKPLSSCFLRSSLARLRFSRSPRGCAIHRAGASRTPAPRSHRGAVRASAVASLARGGGGLAKPDPEVFLLSAEAKGTAHRWGIREEALRCQYATVAPSAPEGLDGELQCRAPGP